MKRNSPDVAIIGGGPGGSTLGTFLRQYRPDINVVILEREKFPRDHVGESQLPACTRILHEMGAWDKVEAAGFPIKIGATYKWGKTTDLWEFEFLPIADFIEDQPRPGKYEGFRKNTAFQVDRAIYDKILLDHAGELGCEIREEAKVQEILKSGDKVTGLKMADGSVVEAKYYVDASGHSGILRRAMGVESQEPASLRNIAIWDYWKNADWALRVGVGGTKVQVMSLGYGWIWFIPLGPDRTSCGLVCPADYYKKSGKKPAELYAEALASEPRIAGLMKNAVSENLLTTTKDWSFVASRMSGDNWFLCGEASGFADPILAAGLSITHVAAKELACTIIEMERGELGKKWLRDQYEQRNQRRIEQHIRFGNYWYTANAQFTDLKEFTREIASDAGLDLDADRAWQWLGTGGFIEEDIGQAGIGTYSLGAAKQISNLLDGKLVDWKINQYNVFRLNLERAKLEERAIYQRGRVTRHNCYVRNGKVLPVQGPFGMMIEILSTEEYLPGVMEQIHTRSEKIAGVDPAFARGVALQSLEALILDGWVDAKYYKKLPLLDMQTPDSTIVQATAN